MDAVNRLAGQGEGIGLLVAGFALSLKYSEAPVLVPVGCLLLSLDWMAEAEIVATTKLMIPPAMSAELTAQLLAAVFVGAVLLAHTYNNTWQRGPYGIAVRLALCGGIVHTTATRFGTKAGGATLFLSLVLGFCLLQRAFVLFMTLISVAPASIVFSTVSQLLPRTTFTEDEAWSCDGCSPELAAKRKKAFHDLAERWNKKFARCIASAHEMQSHLSDLRFSSGRVFLPFQKVVGEAFEATTVVERVEGTDLIDLDGNHLQDISGSYGLNVIGYGRYKEMLAEGNKVCQELSCALGPLNPLQVENIKMIAEVAQQEEVSLHMSGTEAVMCAVRLARFNSGGKPLVVTFNGAYHGWWDGMQPVAGNERVPGDVLCLKDISAASLRTLRLRSSEIAAVLVNPLQCFHPNSAPPSDLALPSNMRSVKDESDYYRKWLAQLRETCTASGIFLIFDEVYTGFRLAPGGAQELFDVHADMVVYGKTLAGGNPIGVVAGPKRIMNRSDDGKPARVAYVIGTFAGHPGTMGSMNAFLNWVTSKEAPAQYDQMHSWIDDFISKTNQALAAADLPLQVKNFQSIWSMIYTTPGRYHWMLQYYLKDEGVNLSWVGTGRCLFSMDWQPRDYRKLTQNILRACKRMKDDGWWEVPSSDIKRLVGMEMAAAFAKGLPKKLM